MDDSTENEVWKEIEGYEGMYVVSSLGRVKSLPRIDSMGRNWGGNYMKPIVNNHGYCFVALSKNSKKHTPYVHRLVASAFLNLDENQTVDHINSIRRDNRLSNLRIASLSENIRYRDNKLKQFSEKQKYQISKEDGKVWKDLPNHPNHCISSDGEVWNKEKEFFRKTYHNKNQLHGRVCFRANGKKYQYTVAKLVAELFLIDEEKYSKKMVKYKDGDPTNLNYANLYYAPNDYLKFKHLL